jgi:hypothetical protein
VYGGCGILDEFNKNKYIKAEISKLKKIFANMPKDRLKAAEGLIKRAAFMSASLTELEAAINEKGYTDTYQNGKDQTGTKKLPEVEIYNAMVKNYTATIRALVDMVPSDTALDPEAVALLNHVGKRK